MTFTAAAAIYWSQKLIAIAILLQTIELILLRKMFAADGIWRWQTLKKEFEIFPPLLQRLLAALLNYPNFLFLLLIQLSVSALALIFPLPGFFCLLLLSAVLICLRFRGTFNGGSDYMTIIVLSTLCVASTFQNNDAIVFASLWYLGIQLCLSYFISGVSKLKQGNWRTGAAFAAFLNSSVYQPPQSLQFFSSKPAATLIASWGIIIFECSFPLALLNSELCAIFIAAALLFHLTNIYIFGLNRFLFAWAAAYPALYFCSQFGGS